MHVMIRRIPAHPCSLEFTAREHVLAEHIDAGCLVHARRAFRKMLLVNRDNPESKVFLKSTAEIDQEEYRHIMHHYYMIHPFSEFYTAWQCIMIFVYLLLFAPTIPLDLCFLVHTPATIVYVKSVLDLFCYADMIVTCFTGFVDSNEQRIVLNGRRVFRHYITGYFLIDLVSSLPITLYMHLTKQYSWYPWKCVAFLKLARLATLFQYLNKYFARRRFLLSNLRTLELSIYLFFGVCWFVAGTVYTQVVITRKEILFKKDMMVTVDELMTLTVHILECLMLVGPPTLSFDTEGRDKVNYIFYVMFGSVINMVILSQILRIYKSRYAARNKYQRLLQEIGQYAKYRGIPPDLKQKIFKYVEFKYRHRMLREAEIMNTLSQVLREEIMLHNCRMMIARVEFFRNIPQAILMKLVIKLHPEVYLKNEVVYNAGSLSNSMFFVYVGKVALYSPTGREGIPLDEGKHFGEVALINNRPRIFTVVARTDCQLLRLNRKDLLEVLQPYPTLVKEMVLFGHEKMAVVENILSRMST